MSAIKHEMDAVAQRMGIKDPNDPRVLAEVGRILGDVGRGKHRHEPDFEEMVSEKASELALKWTGYEFETLPGDEQYKVWLEAERQITDQLVSAAEARHDLWLDRKMGI